MGCPAVTASSALATTAPQARSAAPGHRVATRVSRVTAARPHGAAPAAAPIPAQAHAQLVSTRSANHRIRRPLSVYCAAHSTPRHQSAGAAAPAAAAAVAATVRDPATISVSAASAAAGAAAASEAPAASGRAVVEAFYGFINGREVESALDLIADDCVYEDMIYAQPFAGKDAIRRHFVGVLEAIPPDLEFVIDDISGGEGGQDPAVGLTWHGAVKGVELKFSRGCSFYRCDWRPASPTSAQDTTTEGKRLQIVYARDIPEPAIKPGNITLVILRLATSVQRLLQK